MGTFLLACHTRVTEGSNQMVYIPGILPVVSNDRECFLFLKEITSCTSSTETESSNVLFSMGLLAEEWSWKGAAWPWKGMKMILK